MRRRTNRQKIDHHQFAVVLPARIEKPGFRMPSHGKRGTAIQHPRPVHAFVNFCGELLDLLVVEILPRGEDAAQQNRSIDGRDLALLPALPSLHVDEVIEKTMFVVQIVGEKLQCPARSFENLGMFSEFALIADAQAGQAKSRGSDT